MKQRCEIPVFHDDQHGTAIVTLAALMNALKLTGRKMEKVHAVVNGPGAAGTAVVGTGRSDFPNQINNVLAFPGIFRGALDVRAKDINDEMKLAAATMIVANVMMENSLTASLYFINRTSCKYAFLCGDSSADETRLVLYHTGMFLAIAPLS